MKNRSTGRLGGFTLIELLVVVLIIGILSAIALPQYSLAVEKAHASEALIHLKAIKQAGDLCFLENSNIDDCLLSDLDIKIPGVVIDTVYAANGKYFRYTCDNIREFCLVPYAVRLNSDYDYVITLNDHSPDFEGRKNTCFSRNEKGARICKALSVRMLLEYRGKGIYEL